MSNPMIQTAALFNWVTGHWPPLAAGAVAAAALVGTSVRTEVRVDALEEGQGHPAMQESIEEIKKDVRTLQSEQRCMFVVIQGGGDLSQCVVPLP